MFRSMFGDPKPIGFDQLTEALVEVFGDYDGKELSATIDHQESGQRGLDHFDGYSAQIEGHNADDEFLELGTGGYEDRAALVADLTAAGIPLDSISDGE